MLDGGPCAAVAGRRCSNNAIQPFPAVSSGIFAVPIDVCDRRSREAIGKLVPAISSGMDALNQKIDASKPVSIESVKDKTGKITHGIATYANGDKRTITVN